MHFCPARLRAPLRPSDALTTVKSTMAASRLPLCATSPNFAHRTQLRQSRCDAIRANRKEAPLATTHDSRRAPALCRGAMLSVARPLLPDNAGVMDSLMVP